MNDYEVHLDKIDYDELLGALTMVESCAKLASDSPWKAYKTLAKGWCVQAAADDEGGQICVDMEANDANYIEKMDPKMTVILCAIARDWAELKKMSLAMPSSRLDHIEG